ncbi:hypothetical protein, partial [Chromobacterium subtsugae]|uniref:hypothetical protein n=1 Tax=Chromobacterium subtsugae TaxID=251747 RepID=UPI001AD84875
QSGRWATSTKNNPGVVIDGNNACGHGAVSAATCPNGKLIYSGGYVMTAWWSEGQNSPDSSLPLSDTQWQVNLGGGANFCAKARIICR